MTAVYGIVDKDYKIGLFTRSVKLKFHGSSCLVASS